MDMDMLKRPVNVGFSGGEKKRAEMVQMGILDPKLAILDETDSGLDIDALRICGEGINAIMRRPDKAVLLITHYQRLLDYVKPDFVHAGRWAHRPLGRAGTGAGTRTAWLRGGGVTTAALLPTKADEAFRYADLAALATLWPCRRRRWTWRRARAAAFRWCWRARPGGARPGDHAGRGRQL
jgi:hypothetical protein